MKILLATLHARYVHSSLALPCLAASCMGLDGIETVIREFTVNEPYDDTLHRLAAEQADIAAFSCYIWNIEPTLKLAADLKKVIPDTVIVLGGPEAGYGGFELMERNRGLDIIVRGEGEETFRELAAALLRSRPTLQLCNSATLQLLQDIDGLVFRSGEEIIATPDRPSIDLDRIPSPFSLGFIDMGKPLVYYETSRGCPFSCAFCMSSLEKGVRSFSPERIEADLRQLIAGGVRTVKLVDRTFNYDAVRADRIWEFIRAENRGSSFHFEIAADLLTEENFRLLEKIPPATFRFEIGLQSENEQTLSRVGRHSDLTRLSANVRRLIETTGITVHLDLLAGLPHEDYEGFLDSLQKVFDLLSPNNPYAFDRQGGSPFIQVEVLKVLKGSPMRTIARDEGYSFSDTPPYKILRTPWLSFVDIGRIEAISRLIDLYFNSGRFTATLARLARSGPLARFFDRFVESRGLSSHDADRSLAGLFGSLWSYGEMFLGGVERELLREALCYDYCLAEYPSASGLPRFFQGSVPEAAQGSPGEKPADLARRLGIAKGCRVRSFSMRFARDPRQPDDGREAVLRFVYASAPGKGLKVLVEEKDRG